MRKLYFLVVLLFSSIYSFSQASSYSFTASNGTYIQVTDATATVLPLVLADTYISPAQSIGFDFVYEGVTYTQFKMSSNGFISLGTGTSSLTTNNFSTANATSRPVLAPLWDDLDGNATGSVSKALYEVTGTAPNRVLTVEWRNWEWNYGSSTPVLSFQVKLYETSNKIEFIYRQESGSVNSGSASIGIGSATGSGNGSYLNLTSVTVPAVSSTSSVTNISTKPPTGQVYTFTPSTCLPPISLVASALTTTSATVSWTESAAPPASGYIYELRTSGAAGSGATGLITSGTTLAGITSANFSSLTPATIYTMYIRSDCGSGDFSSWTNVSFTTLCNPVTTLPWAEGFESLTTVGAGLVPVCMKTQLVTGTNWTSANTAVRNSLGARTGTNYVWSNWSSDTWLYTPGFNLTAGTAYDFSFYYRHTDAVNGLTITTTVGDAAVAANMTTTLGTITNPTNTTYLQAKYTFVAPSTGEFYFGIHSVAPTTTPWYFEVDDMMLEVAPTCGEPTSIAISGITNGGASVNWNAPAAGSPVDYQIYYSTTNTAPTAATPAILTGQSSPATLSGLTANTTYYIWVRSNCGGSDISAWASGGSFTTACNPITTFPWTENFNGHR
jgi:hypothetical protein